MQILRINGTHKKYMNSNDAILFSVTVFVGKQKFKETSSLD